MTDRDAVHKIFGEALTQTPERRAAYLDTACNADARLRAEIESLLSAHEMAREFLSEPTMDSPPASGADGNATFGSANLERIGSRIGRYKLTERLGEGGFGVVFMAEQQQPVRRKVALKVLKPGMDTRQVIARFEAERQTLARMEHENIAKVFDAGATDSGRPYFVMELVKGIPITDFCDKHKLVPKERLKLFIRVCRAVQHAHTKGVIHRDIKPTNVLVTLHDGNAVPKVIDFGIAKALGAELADQTQFTQAAQLIGTPLYMSPEQAAMTGQDIDTRSDVFSLGVMLYQLLTGTTPFEQERLRAAGMDEVRRILKEEDPPSPSARLSTLGDKLTIVSTHCRMEPRKLGQLVRGDLDWIVMKCLEKDRARRYETVNGLSADIRRFLNDEAVEASPPSSTYRLGKLVRKHRKTAGVVGGFVLLLVAATVISAWLAARAIKAEASARFALTVALEKEEKARAADMAAGLSEEKATLESKNALAAQNLAAVASKDKTAAEQRAEKERDDALAARKEAQAERDRAQEQTRVADEQRKEAQRAARDAIDARATAETRGQELRSTLFGAQMNLASSAAGTVNGLGLVRELIAPWRESQPDLRGWEYYYLAGLGSDERMTLRGHRGSVLSVAWSPDGARLASGGADSTIRLWNATTGAAGLVLRKHTDDVTSIAFSPDSKCLASGSLDKTVKIWDLAEGTTIAQPQGHSAAVHCVSWSPDGAFLASAAEDGTVKIWTARGVERATLRGHVGPVISVAWSRDGRRLASSGRDGNIRIWNWNAQQGVGREGAPTIDVAKDHGYPAAVAWVPDGSRVAAACALGAGCLYEVATGLEVPGTSFNFDQSPLKCVAWSPDGLHFATGGAGMSLVVRDPADRANHFGMTGHTGHIESVAWSPDSTRLASASRDGTLKLWAATPPRASTPIGKSNNITSLAWSPDGSRLASSGLESSVRIWDPRSPSGKEVLILKDTQVPTRRVAWSPDGKRLATACDDSLARIWDPVTGTLFLTLRGHAGIVFDIAWNPDGTQLATASQDATIKIWDPAGRLLRTISGHKGWVRSVVWSPDGTRLASASADNTVKIWNTATGDLVRTLAGHGRAVRVVAWSPEGTRLASGSEDSSGRTWDASTGKLLHILREHTPNTLTLTSLSWSPDGHRLAIGYRGTGTGAEAKIWNPDSGIKLMNMPGPGAGLVAWSPDGMCLADGGIRITDASAGYGAELSPQLLRGLNQRLAADPGNAQQLRLRAQVYAGMADWDNAQADSRRWLNARSDKSLPWFIAGNWGAGPFPPDLDGQYAPEGPFDPARPLVGPEGQLNWRLLPEDPNGYIDLGILVSELGDNSAYVVSSIYSEQSQQVTLTIACDDPIRIWLNSKVAYELKTPQSAPHDPARVPVTLEAGWNTLLSRIVHVSRNDASGPPKVALEPARRAP